MCLCSGWLVIAEVRSRLDPNNGGADPEKFSKAIIQLGFSFVSKVCIFWYLPQPSY
jgi:ribosomal RNA-processing protein 8